MTKQRRSEVRQDPVRRFVFCGVLILAAVATFLIVGAGVGGEAGPHSGSAAPTGHGQRSAEQHSNGDVEHSVTAPREHAADTASFRLCCLDSAGVAVPAARLTFSGADVVFHGRSDEQGRYTGEFQTSVLHVTASAPGVGRASGTLRASAGSDQEVVLRLIQLATVKVTVLGATGEALVGCPVDLTIAGVTAEARGFPAAVAPQHTSEDGVAFFEVDGYGIYSVVAHPPSGGASRPEMVQVRPGAVTETTIYLAPSLVIAGHVVDEYANPVAKTRLLAVMPGREIGSLDQMGSSSSETGAFSISVPRPGRYLLCAWRDGYEIVKAQEVHVDLTGAPQEVLLQLTPSEGISGKVVERGGSAVPGITVRAELVMQESSLAEGLDATSYLLAGLSDAMQSATDDSGVFHIHAGIESLGRWRIVAEGIMDGWQFSGSGTFEQSSATASEPITLEVERLAVSPTGYTIQADDAGPDTVWWRCRRIGAWAPAWTESESVNGLLHFSDSAVGNALLCVDQGKMRLLAGTDLLSAMRSGHVQLVDGCRCRATLQGVGGDWLDGARVLLHRLDGRPSLSVEMHRTDTATFVSEAVPMGTYSVTVVDGWKIRGRAIVDMVSGTVDVLVPVD